VDAAQRFLPNEPLQCLDAEGEFAQRQRSFRG